MKTVKTKTYLIKKTKIDLAIFYFILSMENAIEVDGLMVLFFYLEQPFKRITIEGVVTSLGSSKF
jgi:hypothetical protein